MGMAVHVRILAWLHIVMGGLGILAALLTYAGAALLPQLIQTFAGDAGDIPNALIQIVATAIIGIFLLFSLPTLALGFGLYYLRPWARVLGYIISALNLLHVPLGTVLGLYSFWVLLKPETEALFREQAART